LSVLTDIEARSLSKVGVHSTYGEASEVAREVGIVVVVEREMAVCSGGNVVAVDRQMRYRVNSYLGGT
jgi:hypothetical protein